MRKNPIISITGTKGKTTVVNVVDDILRKFNEITLKVDTTGHYVDGERRSTLKDSKDAWGLVPTVCPGRYLWEVFQLTSKKKPTVSVLECSLGSSQLPGLGYRSHDTGVFLNVFEDHIGSADYIQNKDDIAKAKNFVFSRIKKNGSIIFNADDSYVTSALTVLSDKQNATAKKIPVGINFSSFDVTDHLSGGGLIFTVNDKKEIILKTQSSSMVLVDIKQVPWTFNGSFVPSIWNLLFAVAIVYDFYDGDLPANYRSVFESVRLDKYGGRLTLLESKSGIKLLADYAHEKVSLIEVGNLARGLAADGGKVIGVVRLAYDRTDKMVAETGKAIASKYDEFVVFDKIDGYWRLPQESPQESKFVQAVGKTSKTFTDAIKIINPKATRIIREDEAIEYASKIAKPGDVVVVIVNEDIKRSIGFIQKSFNADFV